MEAIYFTETPMNFYQTALYHMTDDGFVFSTRTTSMKTLGSRPSAHVCNHSEEQAMTTAAGEGAEDSLNVRLRRSTPSPDVVTFRWAGRSGIRNGIHLAGLKTQQTFQYLRALVLLPGMAIQRQLLCGLEYQMSGSLQRR
jgi:hypothetical protein